ncbi:hypothetical protein RI444_21105 [Paenarthrobacter sp. AT5]|nr:MULTISPECIES: hypothetical protein [Paenarthrobacter]WOC60961.1 hypothetical protein RI444_21105 [Paenarthrobacter sp. AT5]
MPQPVSPGPWTGIASLALFGQIPKTAGLLRAELTADLSKA